MVKRSLTIKELASLVHATVEGESDGLVSGVNDLADATFEEVSFLANERYVPCLKTTKARAIIIKKEQERPSGKTYLLHENPSEAFQKVLDFFYHDVSQLTYFPGIHPTAIVHETTVLGKNVQIGPYAVIDGHTHIADGVIIGAHVSIGPHCTIGAYSRLYPHSVLRERTVLGERCSIQPGAVLGSCGYGYSTNEKGIHTKLEQWGQVELFDDVEVGANTTIDRARFKATSVGSGTKIDNLVQIAHNVRIGKNCLIVSQVGIAGSTTVGDRVILAGKVGLNGHIDICSDVLVAACSSVSKTITVAGKYSGVPAIPLGQYNRMAALLRQIEKIVMRLGVLEKKMV